MIEILQAYWWFVGVLIRCYFYKYLRIHKCALHKTNLTKIQWQAMDKTLYYCEECEAEECMNREGGLL
jgi:hypothetical protein